MFAYAGLVALLAGTAVVRADPVPTAPGPGDVFKEGTQCTFTWDVDTTGTWKEMNVELMTGDNFNMIHLTTVAKLDGTDASKTTFSYDCPQVTPNSAIYFYQFTSPTAANRTWTTRFAIGDASGNVTPPPNATQPGSGDSIPWGVGQLVDPSTAVAAPSYLTGGAAPASSGAGQTVVITNSAPANTAPPASSSSLASPAASSPASSAKASSTGSASGAPASGTTTGNNTGDAAAGTNGAVSALAADGYLVRAAVALGAAAFTFAVAL
ncbi:hypothetical protein OH77DRAFT_1421533 [Trametes cingulata]|nr:hypothetical protein OH77DRAFT_1421533 [Trametes cingulata]